MEQIKESKQSPNTEWPVPIMRIYSGPDSITSKTTLYELRDEGIIKFHYLKNKPYVYMSEVNAAMTTKDLHK